MPRSLFARGTWSRLRDGLHARRAVLVALDLDGTLAPIAEHPEQARVLPRMLRLLEESARSKGTRVAIVSARSLAAMRWLLPITGLHRVGQYGLEGPLAPPTDRRASLRRRVAALARRACRDVAPISGAWVERKGLTLAIHDRAVAPPHRAALGRIVRRLIPDARRLGFIPMPGQRVTDFVPAGFDKGTALRGIIRAFRPEMTLYFGDSPSDEPAFRVLGTGDFPVRVGLGPTRAPYRVGGPNDVARVLDAVVRFRAHAAHTPRR